MSHDHYYFRTQSVVNKVHPQLIKRSLCTITIIELILSGNTMARVLWNLPLFLLICSYINAIGTSEITYYTVCTVSWHYAHMPFITTLVVRLSHVYKLVLNIWWSCIPSYVSVLLFSTFMLNIMSARRCVTITCNKLRGHFASYWKPVAVSLVQDDWQLSLSQAFIAKTSIQQTVVYKSTTVKVIVQRNIRTSGVLHD